jgi:PHD/YefM family antitoxin component YafN of YafNO toxin-antitoxin module
MKTQYITNEKGKKTAVILPVRDYENLLLIAEEYEDIKTFDAAMLRLNEGKDVIVSFEDVLKSIGK